MRGWILFKHRQDELLPEAYEIHRLLAAGVEAGIELRVVKPSECHLIVTRDDGGGVRLEGQPAALPDFLLPRMGASTGYFALAAIRHLERLGVRSFNPSAGIETSRDKLYTQQILAASGLPFAKTLLAKFPVEPELVAQTLGFPVVVKTVTGSLGTGVFLAEDPSRFEDVINLICAAKSEETIILQEMVSGSYGRDLRVITIGGRAVACMQRTAKPGSFKANVALGATVSAYPLTDEIEWLAGETSRIFGLDIAGVDLLFDGDHFRICEINSAPMFKGMEECHDIDVARLILEFVRIRLGAFQP